MKPAKQPADGLLYLQAALYGLAVGAVFISGYQLTLRHAARTTQRWDTALGADAWVPLWPWSIVLYSSINLVYIAAFFVCAQPAALRQLSTRLLAVQLVAFACFWAFPAVMLRTLPPLAGLPGQLYQWLGIFDQPHNLLPSLHIAVLGVLWHTLRSSVALRWRLLWHSWALAVAVSALTTWQHHVLDVLAGALLAGLVVRLTGAEKFQDF